MKNRDVAQIVHLMSLILVLVLPTVRISYGQELPSVSITSRENPRRPADFVEPVIYHVAAMDQNLNTIQDRLERLALQALQINQNAVLPVVVTLESPASSEDLEFFKGLGGTVRYVYDSVTYGFAGVLPASNLSWFAGLTKEKLIMIEHDMPLRYHLDVSTSLIGARPITWNTYGYTGNPNQSIAILDTGIDDTHPDLGPYHDLNFSSKIVGWYDATSDGSLTPEDYGEHGSHVAGIAAGTGAANGLQEPGTVETTFAYFLPSAGYGYFDYIDVMTPGSIQLALHWSGPNSVLLRLSNPGGAIVSQSVGGPSPLTIEYSTEGSSYPTGRYEVVMGNYLGPAGSPFSCVETYPYEELADGHGLFSGVAPSSKLVGVKVFDNTGSGTFSTLLNAMDWIIANRQAYNIVVASMSLSLENGATDSTLDQKADTMVQNGIVTTVSAANDYPTYTIGSPGTAAYVITVAATNDQNGIALYSSNGDTLKTEFGLVKPDVAAPGGTFNPTHGNRIISVDSNDVDGPYSGFSDHNTNDYQQMGGTSMSAPHVAGLAALVIQAMGNWNWTLAEALQVKMLISMTTFEVQSGEGSNVPLLDRGDKDNVEGYGRVCADAVIEATTMNYDVGDEVSALFGSDPSAKKVWARQVYLPVGSGYMFNLTVPVAADYDLYVYARTPDGYGQPVILSKSINASLGGNESIQFRPSVSDTYYLVAKWVSGDGNFTLSSAPYLLRDVAVTDIAISDTAVYVGDTLAVTVTVRNYGDVAESFNVTAFYNSTVIEMKRVSDLAVGAAEIIPFSWDTSAVQPCSNYTIRAEASVVPNESSLLNNVRIDGHVKVKMRGDIDGDGIVNVLDLTVVSIAYGTFEGEPDYDPIADLNNDGVVDMRDLATVARNLGNTCS